MNKPNQTDKDNAPRIISDVEVLHRASSEVWPRVTRVQTIEYMGKTSEVKFWYNANGSLHHVA